MFFFCKYLCCNTQTHTHIENRPHPVHVLPTSINRPNAFRFHLHCISLTGKTGNANNCEPRIFRNACLAHTHTCTHRFWATAAGLAVSIRKVGHTRVCRSTKFPADRNTHTHSGERRGRHQLFMPENTTIMLGVCVCGYERGGWRVNLCNVRVCVPLL